MNNRTAAKLAGMAILLLLSFNVQARRDLRVEFLDWSNPVLALPGPDCPGTAENSTLVDGPVNPGTGLNLSQYTFSGFDDPAFLTGTYCQEGNQFIGTEETDEYLNAESFGFDGEEEVLRTMIGANEDNRFKAIRYSFFTVPFDAGEPPSPDDRGFQWAFYTFDDANEFTLVELRGLVGQEDENLTSATTYIKRGSEVIVDGADGISTDGEYYCFLNQTFLGVWTGETTDSDDGPIPVCQDGPDEDAAVPVPLSRLMLILIALGVGVLALPRLRATI